MKFYEFGKENDSVILLLPGTCCHWKLNFGEVIPLLKENFRVVCVSYDGFDYDDDSLVTLEIPATLGGYPVTGIGYNAFEFSWHLKKVILPATIKEIGWYAFANCVNLESITLPYGLESIGKEAFYRCRNLRSLDLPDSLTNISDYAFYGCDFEKIEIPASVDHIGNFVFGNNRKLKEIIIKGKDTYVHPYPFSNDGDLGGWNWDIDTYQPSFPGITVYCWKGSSAEEAARFNNCRIKYFEEDAALPKTGDDSLPLSMLIAMLGASLIAAFALKRRTA